MSLRPSTSRSSRRQRRAFEATALVHLDALYGVAYRLTRHQGDAEDLVQDALLRAYRFWHTFQEDSNCRAWLVKILTNIFLSDFQKKKRGREVLTAAAREQEAIDGVLAHAESVSQRDPAELLIARMMSDDVARALAELPPDFCAAVVLCDLEGLSYKEIAEAMEIPIGTVMSRLYRGRRLLQNRLRSFAIQQGIVKPSPDSAADGELPGKTRGETPGETPGQMPGKMIDLSSYRK